MSDETMKVYTVNTAFEHEGLEYKAGEKYEILPSVAATFEEGTVTEFVEEPAPGEGGDTPEAGDGETKPATPWVGGHTVS